MPLHYGLDYLSYAIASVIDVCDVFYVLYSADGSHGRRSSMPCPDSRDDLYALAEYSVGAKLRWVQGDWRYENEQRDSIFQLAPDAAVILSIDSDEVYGDGLAADAVDYALKAGAQRVRLPFIHLWRSFKRGFAHDPAYPERVIVPSGFGVTVTMPTDKRVFHFGYAQRSEIVRYKLMTHGHAAEFRRDVDWLNSVFLANRQYDCHPVGSEHWNAEDIDLSRLPSILEGHPYRDLDLIP